VEFIMNTTFHTKLSTWLVVASLILTAFIALPTWHNISIGAIIVVLQVVLVWQARREGRDSGG
jgi:hypothetical protein